MKRKEAIDLCFSGVKENDIFVISNGMIARDVYALHDRPLNFYMLGSMGCALGIGIGIAYTRPDLKVNVISGDGAALMGLSTFALADNLKLKNLHHWVLDNNCHATTGGQKTCQYNFNQHFNTYCLKISSELLDSPRIPLTPIQIKERFCHALRNITKK